MQQLGSVPTPSIATSLSTYYHPLTYSPTFTLQAVVGLTQIIPPQVLLTQSSSARQGHERWAGAALGTSMLSQQSCCHHSLKGFSALELKKLCRKKGFSSGTFQIRIYAGACNYPTCA